MDFEKIKPAVDEISLSDEQTAKILEACKAKKRKKRNVWIPVAVAAACTAIVFSPTVFIGMKGANSAAEADMAAPENINTDYLCDYYVDTENGKGFYTAQSTAQAAEILFERDGFGTIYGIIPFQFASLVDAEEYENWKLTVDASGGMAIAQFVEHFGISKESFDAANSEYALAIGNDANAEAFNSDIIYTFDKETIDSYYAQ